MTHNDQAVSSTSSQPVYERPDKSFFKVMWRNGIAKSILKTLQKILKRNDSPAHFA